jgi:hypothetical protein
LSRGEAKKDKKAAKIVGRPKKYLDFKGKLLYNICSKYTTSSKGVLYT